MQDLLDQLRDRLNKTFGDRLVSVILYGSAASSDYSGSHSDLNILCVLTQVTIRELSDSEPIFHWWRKKGNPSPLLLSEEEVAGSTDCFAIEFHDMRERRKVLAGKDVIEGLAIDQSFYRARVEHELRSKLLRLRQKAAGVMQDGDLLCRLLADSVSTFLVLFRHALLLAGHPAPMAKAEIVQEAARNFGVDARTFQQVLDLREEKLKPKSINAGELLERCLKQIEMVIRTVDALEK
ncbi:MAG: hypothetical protein HYZ37_18620 [Candidatus Solibacter usitatus]|nr:hypothetical protein [Candidatus Solibacter usitatus]